MRVDALINEIIDYIGVLKDKFGLDVSIHDTDGFLTPFMNRLALYNVHKNLYCLLVKSSREAWEKCILSQKKVIKKCEEGTFFGTCYAGVDEFVFPIKNGGVVGFVSVGGYMHNEAVTAVRISAFAADNGFSVKTLQKAYRSYLKRDIPPFDEVAAVVRPLCRMLELLDRMRICAYGGKKVLTANSESVYGHMMAFIERNFAKNVTVGDIAAACHCSVSYVSHTFKKQTGLSVSSYINRMRIEKAVFLLEKTQLSIQEISDLCGFNDSNYFSNVFREHMGVSPRKYRQSLAQGGGE
jgi:AraC-like DNA-binding protein